MVWTRKTLKKGIQSALILTLALTVIGCGGRSEIASVSSQTGAYSNTGGTGGNPETPGNPDALPLLLYSGSETNRRYYDPFETERFDTPGSELGVDNLLRVRITAAQNIAMNYSGDLYNNTYGVQHYTAISYRVSVIYGTQVTYSRETNLMDIGQSQILDLSPGLRSGLSNLHIQVIPVNDDYMCNYYGGNSTYYCPSWRFWNKNIYNFELEVEWDLSQSL